jgi:hypothetical protein
MVTNRVNTMVVSSRLDSRELAMMVLAWELEVGSRPRSMSWLIREIVGTMAELMHKKHGEDVEVGSHQDAFDIIEGRQLRAHSIGSLHALTRGLQAEGLAPSVAEEPRELTSDKMLLSAIKAMRNQGKSEGEISEQLAPLAEKFAEEDRQKEQDRLAAEKRSHEEQIAKFKQQALHKEPELTPEQRTANFEASIVRELGDEWEGPIHKIVIENTRKLWMARTPEGTEAEFDAWLARMKDAAQPKIDSRAERNAVAYETQERERQARKQAKEAVEA